MRVNANWRWAGGLGVVLAAAAAAWAPLPPHSVERWFSTRWYPMVQHVVTPFSNLFPFAVFDVFVVAAAVAIALSAVRAARRARALRSLLPLLAFGGRLAVATAATYLAFLAVWGLNYRRVAMADRLVVHEGAPGSEQVRALGFEAVSRLNALHEPAHAMGFPGEAWRDDRMRTAFRSAQAALSDAPAAVPGRVKPTILGPYFRWTSVDGMVDPFALEVLANPDLLPWERPFVAAHEWAHLAGYADESEANFVGWLTCIRGTIPVQYSGWLYLYWQVSGEVPAADRAELAAALDEGPRHDVGAIVDRIRRGQLPMLRNASWVVYDHYLKANRVEEGIRSYGAVVTLILRARFEDGWTPVRRDAAAPAPGS